MQMPALLPEDLIGYANSETEEALLSSLIRNQRDFFKFFDYACDDEEWCKKNLDFTRKALVWITNRSFQNKLPKEFLSLAAKTIRTHFDLLYTRLPYNLIFKFADTSIQVNSALYSDASIFFHDLIRRECFDKKNFKLDFLNVHYSIVFRYVEEFVNTGYVSGLWKMEQPDIMRLLRYSFIVQMPGLSLLCEEVLSKYLTQQNVFSMVLMAQKESLETLKLACFEFVNNENTGVYLESKAIGSIACKFTTFGDKAMDVFEQIKEGVTHLIFNNDTINDANFAKVVRECPKLIALDISFTSSFSDYFSTVPSDLQELSVNACEWLSQYELKKIVSTCPSLNRLFLNSNIQLTPRAWGELMNLKKLTTLSLLRCQQIRDDEFKIILHACASLTDLSLEECKLLGAKSFYELSKACTHLQNLNLSRTNISDASLVEITSRCRNLINIELVRCENLTDKGVLEAAKNGLNLQEINITSCRINKSTPEEIHKLRPMLKLITS